MQWFCSFEKRPHFITNDTPKTEGTPLTSPLCISHELLSDKFGELSLYGVAVDVRLVVNSRRSVSSLNKL